MPTGTNRASIAGAIFLVWVAAFEQSFAFDRLNGFERRYRLVVSSILGAAGALGISFPPRLGRLVRGHQVVVMATAVVSEPLLVLPAGVELPPTGWAS
jgi:hypothetical protein